MRKFNFKAKNIGAERYLSYAIDNDCEIDEDVLDYCEDNNLGELVNIIYEEDEEQDYLTYNITGKTSIESILSDVIDCETTLKILRNIAMGLIIIKEQAISLSYLLINRKFMYIDKASLEIQFICLPIESESAVATEFKGFVRQLLANFKYDVDEDVNYVGQLLTYINGDGFNLRGLIGLAEALMEDIGIEFEEKSLIEVDGQEIDIVNTTIDKEQIDNDISSVSEFMSDISEDEELPEIEKDEEESEVQLSDEKLQTSSETDTAEIEGADNVSDEKQDGQEAGTSELSDTKNVQPAKKSANSEVPAEDIEVIKNRIKQLVGGVPLARTKADHHSESIKTLKELDDILDSKPPVIKKNAVKVNRAALIQNAADQEEDQNNIADTKANDLETGLGQTDNTNIQAEELQEVILDTDVPDTKIEVVELDDVTDVKADNQKAGSIFSKSILNSTKSATASLLGNMGNTGALKAMPYITRVNTEEIIMLNKPVFKIGKASRGVDYSVAGNGAVSRQHAFIYLKDGVCYIKDNKSTNHTYVNGKKIEEGEEELLTHESKIRLGDEEFIFKIR